MSERAVWWLLAILMLIAKEEVITLIIGAFGMAVFVCKLFKHMANHKY